MSSPPTFHGLGPPRRKLRFDSFADVFARIDQLRRSGYYRLGEWDLTQVLRHLTIVMKWSLDGFPIWLPWPVPPLARWLVLRKVLRDRTFPPRFRTLKASVFPQGADVSEAIREFEAVVRRLETESGGMARSPLFGSLTRDQWRELHLIHCEHHLSFLEPLSMEG